MGQIGIKHSSTTRTRTTRDTFASHRKYESMLCAAPFPLGGLFFLVGTGPLRTPEMLAFALVVDVPRPGSYPDFFFGYGPLRDSVAVAMFGECGYVSVSYYSSAPFTECSLLFSFSRLERLTPLGWASSTCFDSSFRAPS